MDEPITVTVGNIDQIIARIKAKIRAANPKSSIPSEGYAVYMPAYCRLSSRYRGKGRPRDSDYDLVPYQEMIELLGEFPKKVTREI